MPNMGQVISSHNTKISAQSQTQSPPPGCNCRYGPEACPVDGACQTRGVVYQATVTREDNNKSETYTGPTARTFKDRLYEHTQDINNEKRKGTSLSNYVWKLKKQNVRHNITWKILSRRKSFNPATRRCNLCLREKFCIIFKPEGASLNSRSELFSTCRHRKKHLIFNLVLKNPSKHQVSNSKFPIPE